MLIVVCGMPRSATTMRYQLACAVAAAANGWEPADADAAAKAGLGWGWENARDAGGLRGARVVKVHEPEPEVESALDPDETLYLYSFRDPRDAMASLLEAETLRDDVARTQGGRAAGIEHHVRRWLASYEWFTTRRRVLVSRYETSMRDVAGEVRRVADAAGVHMPEDVVAAVAGRLDIDAQRETVRRTVFGEGRAWDERTLLHRGHIHDGASGKYARVLSPDEVALVDRIAGEWMATHGYAPTAAA